MKNKVKIWMFLMEMGHIFGCHQMPERSFFIKGFQFPVCARCTGVYLSFIPTVIIYLRKKKSPAMAVLLCLPMLVDWVLQRLEILPSTNKRRLVTGFFGGIGVGLLQFYIAEKILRIIMCKNRLK